MNAETLLLCEECGTAISNGDSVCFECGAPKSCFSPHVEAAETSILKEAGAVESVSADGTAPSQREGTPFWNVWIVTVLGFFLGYWFATILVALNWHSLKRHRMAAAAWALGALDLLFVQGPLAGTLPSMWAMSVGLLVWFPIVALPQVLYFQRHPEETVTPRPWAMPVGLGVAGQVILLVWAGGSDAIQNSPLGSAQAVYARHGSHVIEVSVSWDEPYLLLFTQHPTADGSAVLLKASSKTLLYVTNRHVVQTPKGATNVRWTASIGREKVAFEVIAYGKGTDLALLRVRTENRVEDFQMPVLKAREVAIGSRCAAIGNALGGGTSLTEGLVSRFDNMGGWTAIRTSTAISPGNSGGGLFSVEDGSLIGITTSICTAEHAQNINLAIPTDYFSDPQSWAYVPGIDL